MPQHAAGKVLPAGSKHYATKRVSCFRRIPYLLNCHAEHSQLKPHTPGQFCTRKSTGSVYLTRTAWLRCLPGLHFGINNDYVLITLYVDNKTPLTEPVKIMENGTERTLRTVGDKWSYLQRVKFGANAQPFYVLIDNEGNPLNKSYAYDEDISKYINFLQTGLENYRKEK